MMLKTVYGPPPANMERIEAAEAEPDSALVREAAEATPRQHWQHQTTPERAGRRRRMTLAPLLTTLDAILAVLPEDMDKEQRERLQLVRDLLGLVLPSSLAESGDGSGSLLGFTGASS